MKAVVLTFCMLCALAAHAKEATKPQPAQDRCHAARAAKLRPIQEARIMECMDMITERGEIRTREQCEAYWGDYGWGSGPPGMSGPRLYTDIPECQSLTQSQQPTKHR